MYTLVVKNKDKMKRYGNGRRKGYSERGRDERTNEQTYIQANRGAKRERGREGRDGGVSMVVECVEISSARCEVLQTLQRQTNLHWAPYPLTLGVWGTNRIDTSTWSLKISCSSVSGGHSLPAHWHMVGRFPS